MKKRIPLIIIISLLVLYVAFIFFTRNNMIGNIEINNINCSFKTYEDVSKLLESKVDIPKLTITKKENEITTLNVSQYCKFTYNIEDIKKINENIPFYERLLFPIFDFSKTIEPAVSIDNEKLNECLIAANGKNMPKNAYIAFNKDDNLFHIEPETEGDILETEDATKIISDAIIKNDFTVDISNAYVKAGITKDNEELIKKLEELNKNTNFTITYTIGDEEIKIDKSIFYDWYEKDENGVPYLNDDKYAINEENLRTFVGKIANKYDNKIINFKTHDNKDIEIEKGSLINELNVEKEVQQLTTDINNQKDVKREPIWKTKGLVNKKIDDTYIEVSIDKQHLWYYKDGEIVLESNVVTGKQGTNDTDKGAWYVIEKTKGTYLTGASWKTWVDYWMPFNNSGEGLHDASWRNKFGSNIYINDGSHGCVNLPSEFAKELYENINVNIPVIIY